MLTTEAFLEAGEQGRIADAREMMSEGCKAVTSELDLKHAFTSMDVVLGKRWGLGRTYLGVNASSSQGRTSSVNLVGNYENYPSALLFFVLANGGGDSL